MTKYEFKGAKIQTIIITQNDHESAMKITHLIKKEKVSKQLGKTVTSANDIIHQWETELGISPRNPMFPVVDGNYIVEQSGQLRFGAAAYS